MSHRRSTCGVDDCATTAARVLLDGEREWLCIERGSVNVGMSNMPGSPGHCHFTSTQHHFDDCGWVVIIPVSEEE